jgi:hypothetical protein
MLFDFSSKPEMFARITDKREKNPLTRITADFVMKIVITFFDLSAFIGAFIGFYQCQRFIPWLR